jgi:hypothetical protein
VRLAEQLYRLARPIYLRANPVCESCHLAFATEIHHKAGREGWLVAWIKYFMPTCRMCHRWITSNGRAAAEHGFKVEVPPTTKQQRAEIESEIRAYIKKGQTT